jgi:hypothetical protein
MRETPPGVSMKQTIGRPNLAGETHQAQRLARYAFGEGAAKLQGQVALGVAALLGAMTMTRRSPIQPMPPTMDGRRRAAGPTWSSLKSFTNAAR